MRDQHATQFLGHVEHNAGRTRGVREVWWLVLTVAFVLFVTTARVSVYRGIEGWSRAGVWSVWRRLAGDLPEVIAPSFVRAGYVVAAAVFIVGCLTALWLALAADCSDESAESPNDRRSEERTPPHLIASSNAP
jgi:hypothetical protein